MAKVQKLVDRQLNYLNRQRVAVIVATAVNKKFKELNGTLSINFFLHTLFKDNTDPQIKPIKFKYLIGLRFKDCVDASEFIKNLRYELSDRCIIRSKGGLYLIFLSDLFDVSYVRLVSPDLSYSNVCDLSKIISRAIDKVQGKIYEN